MVKRVHCWVSLCSVPLQGFSEGAASTFDYSLKDRAPFTVRNALGVPIKVQPNRNLKVMGSPDKSDIYDVDTGQHLELEYDSLEPSRQGKLSILSRQESSFFTLTFGMPLFGVFRTSQELWLLIFDKSSDTILLKRSCETFVRRCNK